MVAEKRCDMMIKEDTQAPFGNDEGIISNFGDATIVIKIAQWRSKQTLHEIRVYNTALWVEEKVRNICLYLMSEDCGIFSLMGENSYQEFLENISLTLSPEPLRAKFRSRAIDALLSQNKL